MMRKLLVLITTLGLLLALPNATLAHGGVPTNGGVIAWEPAGSGGNHTIGVCLNSSFYGGGSWNLGDPAHARLWEAMQTWHNVYGVQALIRQGAGSGYTCPNQDRRLVVYVGHSGQPPFTGQYQTTRMMSQRSGIDAICLGEPWGNFCSANKSLYVNDYWLWYVGTGTPTTGSYDFETGLLHENGHGLGLLDLTPPCGQTYLMCTDLLSLPNGDAPFYMRTLPSHEISNLQASYNPSLHNH